MNLEIERFDDSKSKINLEIELEDGTLCQIIAAIGKAYDGSIMPLYTDLLRYAEKNCMEKLIEARELLK